MILKVISAIQPRDSITEINFFNHCNLPKSTFQNPRDCGVRISNCGFLAQAIRNSQSLPAPMSEGQVGEIRNSCGFETGSKSPQPFFTLIR